MTSHAIPISVHSDDTYIPLCIICKAIATVRIAARRMSENLCDVCDGKWGRGFREFIMSQPYSMSRSVRLNAMDGPGVPVPHTAPAYKRSPENSQRGSLALGNRYRMGDRDWLDSVPIPEKNNPGYW